MPVVDLEKDRQRVRLTTKPLPALIWDGKELGMRFNLIVELKGLFVVKEAGKDVDYHRVIAPRTGSGSVPELEFVVAFNDGELDSWSEGLEPSQNGTRLLVHLPAKTSLTIGEPIAPFDPSIPVFPPATIGDLGLGSLRSGVGEGDWDPAEYGRILLPTKNAIGKWIDNLGKHSAAAVTAGHLQQVADRFVWYGEFEGQAVLTTATDGYDEGELRVRPVGQARAVRIEVFYKENPLNEAGDPFDFAEGLAGLCTGSWSSDNKPRRLPEPNLPPPHPGSSSCPPVRA